MASPSNSVGPGESGNPGPVTVTIAWLVLVSGIVCNSPVSWFLVHVAEGADIGVLTWPFLEATAAEGQSSAVQETVLHVHTATRPVGRLLSRYCWFDLGGRGRLTKGPGHECVYECTRSKPGVKAGAIENIHRRLGNNQVLYPLG